MVATRKSHRPDHRLRLVRGMQIDPVEQPERVQTGGGVRAGEQPRRHAIRPTAAPLTIDSCRARSDHEDQQHELDRQQHLLHPPHQGRRDAVALQQRRQVHVRAERGALQEVDLESHGRAAHHRLPPCRRQGFRGPHRPARPDGARPLYPRLVHARLARITLLVTILTALAIGCARRSEPPPDPPAAADGSPEIALRAVPAPDRPYDPEEYLQLVARRVHVAAPKRSAFWRAVGSRFVSRSTSAILTVGVQVNGQTVGVLPLATVKVSSGNVTREVKANQPLTPPLRVQRGDQVTLQASLVEATEEAETRLVNATKTAGSLASLPVSTAVPGGGAAFDLAGQFWQLARAAGKPQDVTLKREGGLDRPAVGDGPPRAGAGERPQALRQGARSPARSRHRAARRRSDLRGSSTSSAATGCYDPNLVLNEPSPIRQKIAIFLDEMREGGNVEKVKSCRRLRRYLRTTVGVNTDRRDGDRARRHARDGLRPGSQPGPPGRLPLRPGHPDRARRRLPLGKLQHVDGL